jgi:hypothetical protein
MQMEMKTLPHLFFCHYRFGKCRRLSGAGERGTIRTG